jgi:predicted DCC family thiol-disulfide oxidoreductase YuxK
VSLDELLGPARLLLIFDRWCGVCTRTVDWIRARDRAGRVLALPNQAPGLLDSVGLTTAQVDVSVWAIDRRGRRYRGAAAINRAVRELGPWRYAAALYAVPPLRWGEDAFYHWFARNRGRFGRWGSTPACARPGVPCTPEGGTTRPQS